MRESIPSELQNEYAQDCMIPPIMIWCDEWEIDYLHFDSFLLVSTPPHSSSWSRQTHPEGCTLKNIWYFQTLCTLFSYYIFTLSLLAGCSKKRGNRKLDMTTQSNRHSLSFLALSLFGVFFLDKCKNVKFSTKILFSSSSKISYFQTVCPFFLFYPHSLSFLGDVP